MICCCCTFLTQTIHTLYIIEQFSGHEGTWVDNDYEAQVFDKTYYECKCTYPMSVSFPLISLTENTPSIFYL